MSDSIHRKTARVMVVREGSHAELWSDRLKIYENTYERKYYAASFGYTGIVEVEPGKLLFVYDRKDVYPEYDGRQTTAIQGVYVTVKRKG